MFNLIIISKNKKKARKTVKVLFVLYILGEGVLFKDFMLHLDKDVYLLICAINCTINMKKT